ncbi:MAG: hypothetical protein V1897_09760 [Pseudomonadota bacterium]
MNELEKIAIRLKHWIGHNLEHVKSYEDVAQVLLGLGFKDASMQIQRAVELSSEANQSFQAALNSIESEMEHDSDCQHPETTRNAHSLEGSHEHIHEHGDSLNHRHS